MYAVLPRMRNELLPYILGVGECTTLEPFYVVFKFVVVIGCHVEGSILWLGFFRLQLFGQFPCGPCLRDSFGPRMLKS
jgi:hypothetical protein